jgi:ABC-type proline/glycine betaine transport system permease subunit
LKPFVYAAVIVEKMRKAPNFRLDALQHAVLGVGACMTAVLIGVIAALLATQI